jgi:hypothetical protein
MNEIATKVHDWLRFDEEPPIGPAWLDNRAVRPLFVVGVFAIPVLVRYLAHRL